MAQTEIFDAAEPVSIGLRLASSDAFKSLFREGMGLVEESAAYLDGPGREQARDLPRPEALAYAAESMRLTTRLMQLASWLLLQRAVNDGEISADQAASEKRRVKLSAQEAAAAPEVFSRLPEKLRTLVSESLRLQARIMHLDRLLYMASPVPMIEIPSNPVQDQIARVRAAFNAQ